MKALLIEVDFATGKRAGGITVKNNPNLWCVGQDLEGGKEIRLVKDDKTEDYENIDGITILDGKVAINAAIDANIPSQYAVKSEALLIADMQERNIPLSTLVGKDHKQIAGYAFAQKLAGVTERKPKKV